MGREFTQVRKRGNRNWGKPMQAAAKIPTEFEEQIKKLGLTHESCAASETLRLWCERNKDRCYVPEWLLKHWAIVARPDL
jgi:hypothetical protein